MAKKKSSSKRKRSASGGTSRKTASRKTTRKKKSASKKAPKSKPATEKTARKSAAKKSVGKKSATRKKAAASQETTVRKLDRDILRLVNKRAAATVEMIQAGDPRHRRLFDPAADDELWQQLEADNPGPLTFNCVRGVFREVLSGARAQVKRHRVAYLGPPYSFTHIAAIERFGKSTDLIPVGTIASVFEEVNRGHATYGMVPIENSTDGRVVDTLDMFQRLPLKICGEVQIRVHHNLLSRSPRGEITEVYSKPQALSQCREWLARNMPQARLIEVTSTSTAAELAQRKEGVAAVASRQAAVEYDLQIVADDIEDNSRNVTRFAVIGEDVNKPTKQDRTTILMQIEHNPGSLSDSLAIFKDNKINLTWIESFPLRGEEGSYLFFLDFEGHANEARVKRALETLAKKAVVLNVLGSYPRSEPIG